MNHKTKHTLVLLLIITLALTLSACGTESQTAAPAGQDTPADSVSVQFSWLHTIEYSGFYAAEASGYFADENLDVDLRAGGFDADGNFIDYIAEVSSGNADFGISSADRLLVEVDNGAPLVAIAAIYQRNPIAFISLAENNIVKPEDFIGATVQVDEEAGSTRIAYEALLETQGIDHADINEVPRTDFSTDPLTNGDIDVMTAFITNQPVQLDLAGYEINAILASDYGIEIYPDVIFTTQAMLDNNPDLVERFLRATLHGLDDAVADPNAAAELAVTYDDSLNLESETLSMQRSIPLLAPAGSQVGMMTDDAWQTTYEILVSQGITSESVDPQSAYTLDFLNGIYSE